jgi:hypothetical protein
VAETTPGPVRALTESTPVRLALSTIFAALGTIFAGFVVIVGLAVSAALWANNLERKVDDLLNRQQRSELSVDQIRTALGIRIAPTAATDHQGIP